MKANRLINYGLAFSLGLANLTPVVYSQENKFRDYKDGDQVMMIHSNTADSTMVEEGLNLRGYMKNNGGAESVVRTPTVITKTDTLYVKEKLPQQIKLTSLEAKASTGKHWYNSNWFKFFVLPSVGLTASYFISDQVSKSNDKHHTHENTPEDQYNLPEPPANPGVGGGRTGDSETGGVRQ
ncbi:MAG: hypothetical protein Q7R52_03875 [archaeon]|nr:hypothetical protein [archaeon]